MNDTWVTGVRSSRAWVFPLLEVRGPAAPVKENGEASMSSSTSERQHRDEPWDSRQYRPMPAS